MDGDPEAIAVAVDVGFEPLLPSPAALFLFLTEQWERFDAGPPLEGHSIATSTHLYRVLALLAHGTYIFHHYPASHRPWLQRIAAGRRPPRPDPTLPVIPRHDDRHRTGTNYGGIFGGSY